jgi:hypothetical protein
MLGVDNFLFVILTFLVECCYIKCRYGQSCVTIYLITLIQLSEKIFCKFVNLIRPHADSITIESRLIEADPFKLL